MALNLFKKKEAEESEQPSESSNCVTCAGANPDLVCKNCEKPMHKSCSRQWKNERYCKKCWKKVTKQERDLMAVANS
ncbi:MAG: hypothetical protein ABIG20_03065 [archaeon]